MHHPHHRVLRRIFAATVTLALAVAVGVWFQHAVSKPNMMGFDPQEMGRLESAMWRRYYERHWPQLACQTMEGACGQYRFSWWDGSLLSLHAARAALFFRKKTDDPRCLPELDRYYAIISSATGQKFDVRAAAALELQWWKERRRQVAPKDYARTIAQVTALVYGVPEETVLPAARMRADAMAYRDARWDGKMTEAEWQEIARQLMLAYASLKEAVTNAGCGEESEAKGADGDFIQPSEVARKQHAQVISEHSQAQCRFGCPEAFTTKLWQAEAIHQFLDDISIPARPL